MPTALQIVKHFYPKVNQVVPGTSKEIDVEVRQSDVARSKRKSHMDCAMASALRRELPIDGALVSTRTAYLIKGNIAERYTVPQRVHREITSFDRGAGFACGEYHLLPPRPTLPRGSGTRHKGDPKAGKLRHAIASADEIRVPFTDMMHKEVVREKPITPQRGRKKNGSW